MGLQALALDENRSRRHAAARPASPCYAWASNAPISCDSRVLERKRPRGNRERQPLFLTQEASARQTRMSNNGPMSFTPYYKYR